MALAVPALAGSYQLRTKDDQGAAFKNPSGGWSDGPYNHSPYVTAPDSRYGAASSTGPVNSTFTCTGTITTVYDWVPAKILDESTPDPDDKIPDPLDTPPTKVVIVEQCEAKAFCVGAPSAPAGTCDNGLGFPAVTTLSQGGQYRDMISTGTRYKVQDGGASVTVTCTPAAGASDSGTTSSTSQASCSVWYTVGIFAPQIVYTGVTRTSTGYQFLTGQQITCTVDSGGLPIKAGTYAWWDGASSQFKTYNPSGPAPQFQEFTKNFNKVAAFSFYTWNGETFFDSCIVQFDLPTGSKFDFPAESGGVGGTVPSMRINGRSITSVLPTGKFEIESGTVNPDPPTISFGLYKPGTPNDPGQKWKKGKFVIPAPFTDQGQGCFVQIINAKRHNARNVNGSEPASCINSTYGQVALDVGFPYPYGSTWPAASEGEGVDFPSQLLALPMSGSNDWTLSSADDSFDTWMMYRPPAVGNQGTVWIPIEKYEWAWGGTATKDASNLWTLSGTSAPLATMQSHPSSVFPQWISISPHPIYMIPGTPPN